MVHVTHRLERSFLSTVVLHFEHWCGKQCREILERWTATVKNQNNQKHLSTHQLDFTVFCSSQTGRGLLKMLHFLNRQVSQSAHFLVWPEFIAQCGTLYHCRAFEFVMTLKTTNRRKQFRIYRKQAETHCWLSVWIQCLNKPFCLKSVGRNGKKKNVHLWNYFQVLNRGQTYTNHKN